jgi:large subunit ribosomal protein L24
MKNKFSKKWIESKQPRKKRKYLANAPLHLKKKMLSVHLSKELREKFKTRNVVVRKGDHVKVLRGKFKGKTGKIISVDIKKVKIMPSNLQITELVLEDKKRIAKLNKDKKTEKKIGDKK